MSEKNDLAEERKIFTASENDLEYLVGIEGFYVIGKAEINGVESERIYVLGNFYDSEKDKRKYAN